MDPKTDVRERLASKRAGVRWEARRRSLARPGLRHATAVREVRALTRPLPLVQTDCYGGPEIDRGRH
jgi:hypothetical protein